MDTTKLVQVVAEATNATGPDTMLLLACALLGAMYHCTRKAKRLQRSAKSFDWSEFMRSELTTIIGSAISIALALIARENIAALKYGSIIVGNFMYPTFFVIGYFGDSIVDKLLGGYEQVLEKRGFK